MSNNEGNRYQDNRYRDNMYHENRRPTEEPQPKKKKKKKKSGLITVLVIVLILLAVVVAGLGWYSISTKGNLKDTSEHIMDIAEGTTFSSVAKQLKDEGVIKSDLAFKLYVKLNKPSVLQAGEYLFSPSMSVEEIVTKLEIGDIYNGANIQFTYIEGKTIPWLAEAIAEVTVNSADDVYAKLKDTAYLDTLIEKYWFVTDAVKNPAIYYSLEGYLFPDTYTLSGPTADIEEIFSVMLNKMEEVLEPYKEQILNGAYTAHDILTLASVVEGESMTASDRSGVAGVFYNRLNQGMSLGSDITTYYAIQVLPYQRDLYADEINADNPYNTRGPNMAGKLPVGPVCAPSLSAIEGVMNPQQTTALFFVSDKNGKLYFSDTNAEHEATVQRLKDEGLWYTY